MSWPEFKTFLYGATVEVLYFASRPLFAVIHHQRRHDRAS